MNELEELMDLLPEESIIIENKRNGLHFYYPNDFLIGAIKPDFQNLDETFKDFVKRIISQPHKEIKK